MSISQAAVSLTSAFPILPVDEPPRRPGNGPAFAAAMAEKRSAQTGQANDGDPSAADGAAAPRDTPDRSGDTTTDEAREAGVATDADNTAAEEWRPEGAEPGETLTEVLPGPLVLQPRIADAVPLRTEPPPEGLSATGPAPSSAPSVMTGLDPAEGDPQDLPAEVADVPAGVLAAQLPFLPGTEDVDVFPVSAKEPLAATVIPAAAPAVLSSSAQALRAIAGFGQGLSVLRTAEAPLRDAAVGPAPEAAPDLLGPALPTPPPMQPKPSAPAGMADLPDPGMAEHDGPLIEGMAEALPLTGAASGSATMAAPAPAAPAPVLATPGQLAPLVVTAARQGGPADITVMLSPEELGTLQMRVTMEGDALRVTLLAERPETLDLLRRNGEQLLADLRNLGFGGATLGFGSFGGGAAPQPPDRDDAADVLPATAAPQQIPPAPSRVQRAGGLDLRL